MDTSPSNSDSDETNSIECSQTQARRLVQSDVFWVGTVFFLLLVGLVGRYGMAFAFWAGSGAIAALTLYCYLPRIREKKRLAWETSREALLEKWSLIVARLTKGSRGRYNLLHLRVSRLGDLTPAPRKGSLLRPGEYLLWLYLKLLVARDLLEESTATSSQALLDVERQRLLKELESPDLTPMARQSKEETLLILDQRIDTARNRLSRVQEIESDLIRIEQKVALMFDRAAQNNTMGDSGRRINFSDEIQIGTSLGSTNSSEVEELDSLVTAQVYA